jgi:hypothetical protein
MKIPVRTYMDNVPAITAVVEAETHVHESRHTFG